MTSGLTLSGGTTSLTVNGNTIIGQTSNNTLAVYAATSFYGGLSISSNLFVAGSITATNNLNVTGTTTTTNLNVTGTLTYNDLKTDTLTVTGKSSFGSTAAFASDIYVKGTVGVGATSTNPSTGATIGSLYYNTESDVLRIYNGTSWANVGSILGVTGISSAPIENGATLTGDNYIQVANAVAGNTSTTYPGFSQRQR